jgi:hypothetical protein
MKRKPYRELASYCRLRFNAAMDPAARLFWLDCMFSFVELMSHEESAHT